MKTKLLTIAAALVTLAALTSMVSSTRMVAYATDGGDESETNTEQELKQKNVGSGDSTNFNCGQNLINSPRVEQECEAEEEVSVGDGDGDGNGDGDGRFVTICHATGSATNPFVEITIPRSAIPAHEAHQEGEDIIPAPAGGCPTTTI